MLANTENPVQTLWIFYVQTRPSCFSRACAWFIVCQCQYENCMFRWYTNNLSVIQAADYALRNVRQSVTVISISNTSYVMIASWWNIRKAICYHIYLNSFPASGDFCRLLITFANSLDPDQARQNVGPDLDPNCLTLWWYSWKIFLKLVLTAYYNQITECISFCYCLFLHSTPISELASMQRVKHSDTLTPYHMDLKILK